MAKSHSQAQKEYKQRQKENHDHIDIFVSKGTKARLKSIADKKGISIAELIYQFSIHGETELADESIITALDNTYGKDPKEVAAHLISVLSTDYDRAKRVLLAYLKQKYPGFKVRRAGFESVSNHYTAVKLAFRRIAKAHQSSPGDDSNSV